MRHRISAEIDIEALPEAVWAALADLAGYASWNPFIPAAAGTVAAGVAGLFDGRHRFELTGTPQGTHLVQSESFSGLLVRPLRGFLDGGTLAGFEAMNTALRQRVLDTRS